MPLDWYQSRLAELAATQSQVDALRQSLASELGTSNRTARLLSRADKSLQQATEMLRLLALHHHPSAQFAVYLPGAAKRGNGLMGEPMESQETRDFAEYTLALEDLT